MDRQLLELAVAAAELSTATFVCRSVDVVVRVALTDGHVVLLLQVLEKLVARVGLDVTVAAHRLYVSMCFFLNPCVRDDRFS